MNQPENINQSDSFLPTTELAYKTVNCFQSYEVKVVMEVKVVDYLRKKLVNSPEIFKVVFSHEKEEDPRKNNLVIVEKFRDL